MSNSTDFIIEDGVLKKYQGPGGDVVVPDGVKSIADSAFKGCANLTSITNPSSVASIGAQAFGWCKNLTKITIPNGVWCIGNGAFKDCSSLTSITLPMGLARVGNETFSGCRSLVSVTIPNGVVSIGQFAFFHCESLTSIELPESVISIESEAFYGCKNLTSITIPESVKRMGNRIFCDCISLTSVTIPMGVPSIDEFVFFGCRSLKSVLIPESVLSIGQGAFFNCASLTRVTIPHWLPDLKSLPKNDFLAICCTEDSVSEIPANYRCQALLGFVAQPEVDMDSERARSYLDYGRKNAGKLLAAAFAKPELLYFLCEHDLIPAKNYDNYMAEAEKLGNVEFKAMLLEYQNRLGMKSVSEAREKNEKTKESYSDAMMERITARDQAKGIEGITFVITGKMKRWQSRSDVKAYLESYGAHLGASVTKKTDYLVADDTGTGTESVRKAQEYGVLMITEDDFNEMVGWRYKDAACVVIPSWVRKIPRDAFKDCNSMTSVTIPDSIKVIDSFVFQNCNNLMSVTLPVSVTSVGSYAFEYCSNLTNVIIPDSVSSIGDGAFSSCSGLTSVTIPASVTSIGQHVFSRCSKLTIHAPSGSYAEQYAKKNSIPFAAE